MKVTFLDFPKSQESISFYIIDIIIFVDTLDHIQYIIYYILYIQYIIWSKVSTNPWNKWWVRKIVWSRKNRVFLW